MPRSRIPTFEARLKVLCEEAGLPLYAETHYDVLQDTLYFLWEDPDFCLGVPLGYASIYGLGAGDLRDAWDRKFGPDLARREAA